MEGKEKERLSISNPIKPIALVAQARPAQQPQQFKLVHNLNKGKRLQLQNPGFNALVNAQTSLTTCEKSEEIDDGH